MDNTIDLVLDALEVWVSSKNLKLKGTAIKKGGHIQDTTKLYSEFITDLVIKNPGTIPPTLDEFNEIIILALAPKEMDEMDFNFNIPSVETVAEFVPQSLNKLGIVISPLGDEIVNGYGRHINIGDLENLLLCEAHLYNEESIQAGKQIRRQVAATAVKDFIKKEIQDMAGRHWCDTLAAISYDAQVSAGNYADVYLKGILAGFKFEGDLDLHLAVLKQWIWQTKRFFMGRAVTDPLFINLFAAKGGGGKTQIVKKLSEPLEAYTANSTLDTILDSREHGLFTDRFIVFFDEMSLGKIEHGQIGPLVAGLKKLITEDKITQRNMRETSHSKKRRTFSPIATSNQPLIQLLPDDSGMRRFYELEMNAEPNTARIQKLRAINATLIWQSIDENLELGYIVEGSEIHTKLKEYQTSLKHRSVLDDVLENIDTLPILEDSDEARQLAECAKPADAEKLAETMGLLHYKTIEYSKLLKDWTEDNIDSYLKKFIPGTTKIAMDLRTRDFFVYGRDPKSYRIFVTEDQIGGRL